MVYCEMVKYEIIFQTKYLISSLYSMMLQNTLLQPHHHHIHHLPPPYHHHLIKINHLNLPSILLCQLKMKKMKFLLQLHPSNHPIPPLIQSQRRNLSSTLSLNCTIRVINNKKMNLQPFKTFQ